MLDFFSVSTICSILPNSEKEAYHRAPCTQIPKKTVLCTEIMWWKGRYKVQTTEQSISGNSANQKLASRKGHFRQQLELMQAWFWRLPGRWLSRVNIQCGLPWGHEGNSSSLTHVRIAFQKQDFYIGLYFQSSQRWLFKMNC